MHPDQKIFYPHKYVKGITAIAVILYFSAFSYIIYGFTGKHLGPVTTKIMEKRILKEKDKKFAHTKGYKQDSKNRIGMIP